MGAVVPAFVLHGVAYRCRIGQPFDDEISVVSAIE
jgi:hypothetical protein